MEITRNLLLAGGECVEIPMDLHEKSFSENLVRLMPALRSRKLFSEKRIQWRKVTWGYHNPVGG